MYWILEGSFSFRLNVNAFKLLAILHKSFKKLFRDHAAYFNDT